VVNGEEDVIFARPAYINKVLLDPDGLDRGL
jgi:hypothetical protein